MPHKMLIALFVSCLALGAMGGCPQAQTPNNNNDNPGQNNGQNGQDGDDQSGQDNPGDDNGGDDKPGDNAGGNGDGDDKPGDDNGGDNGGSDDKPGDDNGGNNGGTDDKPDDGGDDNNGDDDSPAQIEGAYNGTVRCTITQSLNGTPQNPTNMNRNIGIMFDADGVPNKIIVPGFSAGSAEFEIGITKVGETQTVVRTSGNLTATYIVTITAANYGSTQMSVEMSIEYEGRTTAGDLTQDGTAVVSGAAMLDADDNIAVEIQSDYDVVLSTPDGSISFDTEETTRCTGTLIRN